MSNKTIAVLSILRRQFDPTFQILANLIQACPKSLWSRRITGNPFWQQVLHALIGIQFWFREANEKFIAPDFGQGPIPDLDLCPTFDVSNKTARDYLRKIEKRVDSFFDSLDDKRLMTVSSIYDRCTYADLILMQIRHLQHHVGYCNSLLRSSNSKSIRWLGYAE